MAKLVLMSAVIGAISIPILCAGDTNARRGLFKAVSIVAAFNLLYLFVIRFVYPHLL